MTRKLIVVEKEKTPEANAARAPARRSCLGSGAMLCALLFSGLYLLNPTGGFDFLPDNLPGVGNLDEAFFTLVFLSALAYFGVEIPVLSRRYGVSPKRVAAEPPDADKAP